MVNFAELKAKAEKAKDASVTRMTNTRDRFTSVPSSKVNWDPNWKRAPPPPPERAPTGGPPPPARPGSHPDVASALMPPPVVHRASRLTNTDSVDAHPRSPALPYTPLPPPTRPASGYRPSHHSSTSSTSSAVDEVDWANLSAEDKAAFFGWLDEFFSRYLGIEVGPGGQRRGATPSASQPTHAVHRGLPPVVNMTTRPQV